MHKVVLLFDVDNTLLDNDRVTTDLKRHLESKVGTDRAQQQAWGRRLGVMQKAKQYWREFKAGDL